MAATEGLTARAVRTGAPARSNDASRDPRYLVNQDNSGSELVPILGRRARSRHAGRGKRPRGASSGSSILDYERLAGAVRSLLDQPPRRSCPPPHPVRTNMSQVGFQPEKMPFRT